jgi:hypothetical protein
MRWIALASTLLAVASPAAAFQNAERCPDRLRTGATSERVRPIVVLLETEPWAMVIGADSPRFALYRDGLVIYRRANEYRSVRLNVRERDTLLADLGIDHLACFVGNYGEQAVTDQPWHHLLIGRGGPLSPISVYGAVRAPSTPAPVVAADERLAAFDHPDARPWLPERIEVMIWPYEYAPEPSIIWPSDWPGLDSEYAVRRGNAYSIFLPAAAYPRLIEFLRTRRRRGAVEIGSRKWSAALRFPFPMERMWMRPGTE